MVPVRSPTDLYPIKSVVGSFPISTRQDDGHQQTGSDRSVTGRRAGNNPVKLLSVKDAAGQSDRRMRPDGQPLYESREYVVWPSLNRLTGIPISGNAEQTRYPGVIEADYSLDRIL